MDGVFTGRLALVVVMVVRSMKIPVMHIVEVVTIGNRDMPAAVADHYPDFYRGRDRDFFDHHDRDFFFNPFFGGFFGSYR